MSFNVDPALSSCFLQKIHLKIQSPHLIYALITGSTIMLTVLDCKLLEGSIAVVGMF